MMVTIVIWGIGNLAIDRLLRYSWDGYSVVLVDKDVNKRRGKRILNYPIIEPEKLGNMEFDYLIVGASSRYKSEIRKDAVKYCDEKRILDLDDFVACFKTSHFGVTIALKQHKTTPTYSV